jgi:hypothetical protein
MTHPSELVMCFFVLFVLVGGSVASADVLFVDTTTARPATRPGAMKMGTARSPDGHEITVTPDCLMRDGKPWLPVMGEFHFSRYPQAEWRDELLKMKAGGVDIVATYVFWIHHEEVQGQWDWTGQRELRKFISLCGEIGLPVVVRCGPWCHGEVRNGGLPDWIMHSGERLRSTDPKFLAHVRTLYSQIAEQLHGELWKEGGPVIGMQVDNEFRGPAEYLLALKQIARDVGIDVPMYTRTGWPNLTTPIAYGELLPLFGGYAEGFWDHELTPMPGHYADAFRFELQRTDVAIGTDQLGHREGGDSADVERYPYLTCEIGGGMMNSYHRRIKIDPRDILSLAIVKIGSGSNLPGYYMYHGGTNPEGKLSTLQESIATAYPNDMPVKNYDFQAPLGEFGQIREHYHLLRRLHLFLNDFGDTLALMPAHLPATRPASAKDIDTLRWCVRSDGRSGFVFVNNYQRLQPMAEKRGVQFEVKLTNRTLRFPHDPITIPADTSFFWPFNMDLGDGAILTYATAQPICKVDSGNATYVFFAKTRNVPATFQLDTRTAVINVEKTSNAFQPAEMAPVADAARPICFPDVTPGPEPAIWLHSKSGVAIGIVLLDEDFSLNFWKGVTGGGESAFLTSAGMSIDHGNLRLSFAVADTPLIGMLHDGPHLQPVDASSSTTITKGIFDFLMWPKTEESRVTASIEQVAAAGPLRTIDRKPRANAVAPSDADFDNAAVYRIKLPAGVDPSRDILLRIHYVGDVARAYVGDKFITDDFYNGNAWEIGLKRLGPAAYTDGVTIKILPLQKNAPIYIQKDAMPDFKNADSVVSLDRVDAIEQHHVELHVK